MISDVCSVWASGPRIIFLMLYIWLYSTIKPIRQFRLITQFCFLDSENSHVAVCMTCHFVYNALHVYTLFLLIVKGSIYSKDKQGRL
jgi:hypothetical protein